MGGVETAYTIVVERVEPVCPIKVGGVETFLYNQGGRGRDGLSN